MKKKTKYCSSDRAFTRLELAVVLAALGLLAALALPALAGSKLRAERVNCLSNLRQIAHSVHMWGNDHADRTPWFTPANEGGTRGSTNFLRENAWFQMGWLSNELVTPKFLICPSDQRVGAPRKMANDFTSLPGGFFNVNLRASALSYLIGLHSFFSLSRSILSGDRNIRWDAVNGGCGLGFSNAELMNGPPASVVWSNAIHGATGNILFTDGSAEQLSSAGLQRAASNLQEGDNGSHHFLTPP